MSRVTTLRLAIQAALFALCAVAPVRADQLSDADLERKARAVHAQLLTLDSHVDVLLPSTNARYVGADGKSQADLDKLQRGGIGAITLAIAVGPGPLGAAGQAEARREADAKLAAISSWLKEHPKELGLATGPDALERLHKQGKIGVLESFQNARSIGQDLSQIDAFYREGVRLFAFTHAGNNDFADSSRPIGEPAELHHGLSPLGKQAVERLNRLGVIIDVSQLTREGVLQTLQLTKAPVVASHSAVRSLVDVPRNLSDEELDAIKQNGGVVQITAFNSYLVQPVSDFRVKLDALRKEVGLAPGQPPEQGLDKLDDAKRDPYIAKLKALWPRANVSHFVDHIDYVAKRLGIDHVGIGSDFNHGAGIAGFESEADAPNVTRELVRRGYTEAQIAKIWSGNFLRVWRAVEASARTSSAGK